ncbi:MAG TPA: asparagine synthase B [Longimicrobiales bacterium]|nr:asparagine synthase B [Longimicrobiales bacterium]
MCSILGILDVRSDATALRDLALELSRRQRHRGPDWSGVFAHERAVLAHERLSIVDVLHGAQPLGNFASGPVLAVNGEIYNHRELRARFPHHPFATESDCEVILPLYQEKGADFLGDLNGIFAFVLYDIARDRYVVARDPIGVIPLYTGRDAHGNLFVASEMKALTPVCRTVAEFPPGHVLDSAVGPEPVRYYHPEWTSFEGLRSEGLGAAEIRSALQGAVHRQLMSDVPYGVLLSGGLDSSIISAVAKRYAARRVEEDDRSEAWWPQLHSFAIGLEGAPDLAAAAHVATHIGTVHHEFHFTVQEGLDALRDVIYHLETYDVTTVRASTPMYLMARRIRAMGIKMVLSGEGADEVFGGYLYFHKAPGPREFHEETVRKLARLHSFDCLRANKSMAAWGIEARVPFLDLAFLDVAMNLDPAAKMIRPGGQEKQVLREAFADHLPDAVLRRQKEQFSDGVGYGWIDALKAHAEARVPDRDFENARFRFPHNTPDTKEGYLYRCIFEEHFPLPSAAETVLGGKSVACSTPEALAWDASFQGVNEPSGRAVKGIHQDAY